MKPTDELPLPPPPEPDDRGGRPAGPSVGGSGTGWPDSSAAGRPPPVIDYRRPTAAVATGGSDPRSGQKFMTGVGAGIGIGVLGAFAASLMADVYAGLFVGLFVAPAVVLLVGMALTVSRRTRMVGAGMLATFGLAALILASLCAR